MTPRPSPVWAIVVLATTGAFAVVPWVLPGFGGFDLSQFPVPQDAAPVQPARWAFTIWGVIYTWLVVSAVYGLGWRRDAVDWQGMRPALALSTAIGAAWLPVAMQTALAATVLIWVMLVATLVALVRSPRLDRWYARAPVAFYAGWLTAASAVSLGLVLAGYGIMEARAAAYLMIGFAVVAGVLVLTGIRASAEYGASLAWGLVAIAARNLGTENGVAGAAFGAALVVLAIGFRRYLRTLERDN